MVDGPLLFISYSSKNAIFANRVAKDLRRHGFAPWIDHHKLKGGDTWSSEIEQAIDKCDAFILVLSPDAIKSTYVRAELGRAKRKGKLIIPLHYLFCEDFPLELELTHMINCLQKDKETLNEEVYQKGCDELLKSLPTRLINTQPMVRSDNLSNDNPGSKLPWSKITPSITPKIPPPTILPPLPRQHNDKQNSIGTPVPPKRQPEPTTPFGSTQATTPPLSDDPLFDPPRSSHDFADDADALGPLPVTSTRTPTARDITGPTQAISPARSADVSADGDSIIKLRPRRSSKATLPPTPREPAPVPVTPALAAETDSTTQIQRPKRPSSKIAAVAAGAVVGAAVANTATATPARATFSTGRASTVSSAGSVTPRAGGPGGIPPRGTPPGGGGRGTQRGSARPARLLLIALMILALLLLVGTAVMAYAQPQSPIGQIAQGLVSKQQSPATITITPNSLQVQDNYTLTGAKTTNPATREIALSTITGTAQSLGTPVKATGHNQHQAVAATGQITFHNALSFAQQVNAGTSFNMGGGLQIITDATISVPPLVGTIVGSMAVSAHASPPGPMGNIGALTINNLACCGNGGIIANNFDAFTGGQDAVNYSFLRQSDVNNAISQSIMNVTKQAALNDLNKQLLPTSEQLFGSPRCTPTLQADQQIGDQGTNVNGANVSYLMKCTKMAYDNLGAQNIVKDLLTQKAAVTPGPGYVLVNNIQAILTSQTTTTNTLSFFFTGKGVWAYLFSDAQKLSLEKALAGKTVADAQTILKNTPGISNATINVNGGNTLPTDYSQISIVIQPIAGLGGGTPLPSGGSPTITNPTVESGTPGANGKGGSAPPTAGGS